MNIRVVALVCVGMLALAAGACGQDQQYGSEEIEGFREQQNAQRLGGRTPEPTPEGTAAPLTLEEETPEPKPTPQATPVYFDIALIPDSPYYEPGNQVAIRVGVTLRVTNKDGTAERAKGRSYTAKSDAFSSGLMKPGDSWVWEFQQPGRFEIVDDGLPFATAVLEVVG